MNARLYLRGAGLDETIGDRLRELAALWNRLARHEGPPFHLEFLDDLQALNQFQKDFPGNPPLMLICLLEVKVMEQLEERFSPSTISAMCLRLQKAN